MSAAAIFHLRHALKLINGTGIPHRSSDRKKTRDILATLKRAKFYAKAEFSLAAEPIRTIHHLSCTGGTLIAKCVASMSNVTLLNEIDFHSRILDPSPSDPVLFTPTDIVSLMKQARMKKADGLISDIFLSDISLIQKHEWLRGRKLVLRDHTHSQFLTGESIDERSTMKEQLGEQFHVVSV
ncbi:MAG: hypothetical protein K0U61_06420, partial [Alphaproteobacteria bacterium]|nr:hypothetical protein [Alphaproteobacteria bacterium]